MFQKRLESFCDLNILGDHKCFIKKVDKDVQYIKNPNLPKDCKKWLTVIDGEVENIRGLEMFTDSKIDLWVNWFQFLVQLDNEKNKLPEVMQNDMEKERFKGLLRSITEATLEKKLSTDGPLPQSNKLVPRKKYIPEELITYYLLETFERIIDEKGAENLLFQIKHNNEPDQENFKYNLNN